jgi:hypothetical protein
MGYLDKKKPTRFSNLYMELVGSSTGAHLSYRFFVVGRDQRSLSIERVLFF